MTDQEAPKRDMIISDGFHRTKRTLLLFGAAIIILAFATDEMLTLSILGQSTPLNRHIVMTCLWAAMTYYAFGFWFEARTAHILNRQELDVPGNRGVEEAFAELTSMLNTGHSDVLSEIERIKTLSKAMQEHLPLIIEELKSNIADVRKLYKKSDELDARVPLVRRLEEANSYLISAESVSAVPGSINDLTNRIEQVERKFSQLSSRIVGVRRKGFWAWEIGGAAALYLVATAAVAGELRFLLVPETEPASVSVASLNPTPATTAARSPEPTPRPAPRTP